MKDAISVLKQAAPVMPVAHFQSLGHAERCAELFAEAGVSVVEITLRHDEAWKMIKVFRDKLPDALIGAGTVVHRRQMLRAMDETDFVISPGFSPELSAMASKTLTTYIPGVATATEIMAAMADEHRIFKLFPAQTIGGIGLIKSLAAPFPDALFCPTGGISLANYQDYLALDCVPCVGGSWVVPSEKQLADDPEGCLEELKRLYSKK